MKIIKHFEQQNLKIQWTFRMGKRKKRFESNPNVSLSFLSNDVPPSRPPSRHYNTMRSVKEFQCENKRKTDRFCFFRRFRRTIILSLIYIERQWITVLVLVFVVVKNFRFHFTFWKLLKMVLQLKTVECRWTFLFSIVFSSFRYVFEHFFSVRWPNYRNQRTRCTRNDTFTSDFIDSFERFTRSFIIEENSRPTAKSRR